MTNHFFDGNNPHTKSVLERVRSKQQQKTNTILHVLNFMMAYFRFTPSSNRDLQKSVKKATPHRRNYDLEAFSASSHFWPLLLLFCGLKFHYTIIVSYMSNIIINYASFATRATVLWKVAHPFPTYC